MKKFYTSLLALSLLLGATACSNDDSNKGKDNSKDESSKTEQKDKKSNDHSKDKVSNKDDQNNTEKSNDDQNNTIDNDSAGQNQSDNIESDSNEQAKSTDNSTQQSNNNVNSTNTASNNSNPTASNTNTNNQNTSNQSSQSLQSTSGYVAPYQSENATPVARNLSKENVNQSIALKQLPNFQTALDLARQEANLYGNSKKTYNDYAIEGENANYRYVFSFKDPQQNGVYSIVTVNSQGEPVVVDPAYRK